MGLRRRLMPGSLLKSDGKYHGSVTYSSMFIFIQGKNKSLPVISSGIGVFCYV